MVLIGAVKEWSRARNVVTNILSVTTSRNLVSTDKFINLIGGSFIGVNYII